MEVTLLKDTYPIARKEHRCTLCGHIIKPGEKYHRQTLVYDDKPYEWIEDMDCHKACELVCERLDFYGYDREDGLTEEVFDTEIIEILMDELNMNYVDASAMPHHERMLKVLEHYDDIMEAIKEARREEHEWWKQREKYKEIIREKA